MSLSPYDKDFQYIECEDEDYSGRDYSSSAFDSVVLRSCSFRSTSFKGTSFDNVEFLDCDLSNADFSECSFLNCTIRGGKLSGALFLKARFKNTDIDGVMGQYVSFDEAVANGLSITSSRLLDSSFSDVHHKGLSLENCDLAGTSLKGTSLKGMKLKASDLSGIFVSEDCREFKGARLDAGQALDAARLFGIEIIG